MHSSWPNRCHKIQNDSHGYSQFRGRQPYRSDRITGRSHGSRKPGGSLWEFHSAVTRESGRPSFTGTYVAYLSNLQSDREDTFPEWGPDSLQVVQLWRILAFSWSFPGGYRELRPHSKVLDALWGTQGLRPLLNILGFTILRLGAGVQEKREGRIIPSISCLPFLSIYILYNTLYYSD